VSALLALGPAVAANSLGFDWQRPGWWPVLFATPLLLGLGLSALFARRRDLARLVHPVQRARFAPERAEVRAVLRVILAACAALLLGLAALGPVLGWTERDVVRRGLDIVVCLDSSRSMLATDLRPTRLARAQREVVGLLDALEGDRVALVGFAGDARDVAPLTTDRHTLEGLLRFISPQDNRLGGTDLGAALEHALALFDGRTGASEAIVLLTDGEDLSGRGLEHALEAEQRGIRVYVVGIGTEAGAKIPDGRGFLKGPEGEEVVTKLDGDTLRQIAETTGGEYLSTEDAPLPLEELYTKRIARLDRRDIAGSVERVPHDRYQVPLLGAFLCMAFEALLRERRGSRRGAPRAAAPAAERRAA
jgi:Ca-activated chloride channel family protein